MEKQQKTTLEWLKNKKTDNRQVIAYAVSGVLALTVDNAIFLLFLYVFKAPLAVAVPAGLTSGLVASFALNRQWTFKRDTKHHHPGGRQFVLYVCLFIFNNLFTYVFIKVTLIFGIMPVVSKLLATVCITLWNYLAYKKIIFR